MGMWIGSAGLGYILAGIASFGIGHIHVKLDSWRWIFLIWGIVTVLWGIVILIWLPGAPLTAKFLTEHERAMAINRVKADNTGQENKTFKWPQFREAIFDLKTWLLFLFAVASNSPNGGLTNVSIAGCRLFVNIADYYIRQFQGLIIRGMGFSPLRTALIQMPSGAVQFLFCTSAWSVKENPPTASVDCN
jgi:MFS family permease